MERIDMSEREPKRLEVLLLRRYETAGALGLATGKTRQIICYNHGQFVCCG